MKYPTLAWRLPRVSRPIPVAAAVLAILSACSDNPVSPEMSAGAGGSATSDAATAAASAGASKPAPFQGARLYVSAESNAGRQADAWRQTRPADAALMERVAAQPQAIWFGDWVAEPYEWVSEVTARIRAEGALPVYVLYNIPQRDCGLYSSGGAASAADYGRWVSEVARGIGGHAAVVVLEPDALAGADCLSAADRAARFRMLADAVRTLKASGTVSVYIDAGNARWHAAEGIAERLRSAGIGLADGFALNVSNFLTNEESIRYGDAVSRLVSGKHYVIDTSRNGSGPAADLGWCNPDGRALGTRPTTTTGSPRVDAFLWIKAPGESDGECNGGPRAGEWWAEYALGLARRAGW